MKQRKLENKRDFNSNLLAYIVVISFVIAPLSLILAAIAVSAVKEIDLEAVLNLILDTTKSIWFPTLATLVGMVIGHYFGAKRETKNIDDTNCNEHKTNEDATNNG